MGDVAAVEVIPDDLAAVADALGKGPFAARRIIKGREAAAAVEEAVTDLAAIKEISDDLAAVVESAGDRAAVGLDDGRGIVKGGVGAAVVCETVSSADAVVVIANDFARAVDALREGAPGTGGIIDGGGVAAAVEETARAAIPDNLACVPNPLRRGCAVQGAPGIGNRQRDSADVKTLPAAPLAAVVGAHPQQVGSR